MLRTQDQLLIHFCGYISKDLIWFLGKKLRTISWEDKFFYNSKLKLHNVNSNYITAEAQYTESFGISSVSFVDKLSRKAPWGINDLKQDRYLQL